MKKVSERRSSPEQMDGWDKLASGLRIFAAILRVSLLLDYKLGVG